MIFGEIWEIMVIILLPVIKQQKTLCSIIIKDTVSHHEPPTFYRYGEYGVKRKRIQILEIQAKQDVWRQNNVKPFFQLAAAVAQLVQQVDH